MKITLEENDALIQDDGLPKIVVVNVDGVRFPVETHKTLVELYQAIEKIKGRGGVVQKEHPLEPLVDGFRKDGRVVTWGIDRGDIVLFRPQDMETFKMSDNGELVPGREYRVLDIRKQNGVVSGYSIIDDSHPQKMRLEVYHLDVVLERKTPKIVVDKKKVFEIIYKCGCGEEMVLEKRDTFYIGTCEKCLSLTRLPLNYEPAPV